MDLTFSTLLSILAWTGTIAYLAAYLLVSRNRVDPMGWQYQGLNIYGAITLSVYSIEQRTWPAFALNAAWLAIGVHTVAIARRSARGVDTTAVEGVR